MVHMLLSIGSYSENKIRQNILDSILKLKNQNVKINLMHVLSDLILDFKIDNDVYFLEYSISNKATFKFK
jgi:hypothetical protein